MKNWLKTNWIRIIIAVLLIGGFLWWKNQQPGKAEIVTVKPELRDITEVLNVSGKVDAEEKVKMTFAGASKLTWLPIKEGDVVKKWQGLASVDSRTLKNSLQIAQNTHGKTFRTFENTLDTVDYYSESGLTETERRSAESAQLDIRSSALAVESADVAVKLSYMSSPITGIVTKIDQKNVGALMLPTDAIEIVNPASVYFMAVVDEEDISKVTTAQQATIKLDAFQNDGIESSITRIAFTPTVSESGGTGYTIWLKLPVDNTKMNYRLGMNGEADVVLNKKTQVFSIPMDALVERDGKQYVDVLRPADSAQGKPERVEVQTGIGDETYVEITSGLNPDDLVILPSEK